MMFPLVLYPPPFFETVYCYIYGRRRVAVARWFVLFSYEIKLHSIQSKWNERLEIKSFDEYL